MDLEFECPVCWETLTTPIFQCFNGHLLCETCVPSLKKCPICREDMPSKHIRNRGVEAVVLSRCTGCQFKPHGCQDEIKHDPIDCLFAVQKFCGYFGFSECTAAVSRRDLFEHLLKSHAVEGQKMNVGEGIEIHQSGVPLHKLAVGGIFNWKHVVVALQDNNICLVRTTVMNSSIYWRIFILGTEKLASKYLVKIKILSIKDNNEDLYCKWRGPVSAIKIGEGSNKTTKAFSMTFESIKSLCTYDNCDGLDEMSGWKLQIYIMERCKEPRKAAMVTHPKINNTMIVMKSPAYNLPRRVHSTDRDICEPGECKQARGASFASAAYDISGVATNIESNPKFELIPNFMGCGTSSSNNNNNYYSAPPQPTNFVRPLLSLGVAVSTGKPVQRKEGVPCEACQQFIGGNRYKCVDCRDFDVCSTCIGQNSIGCLYAHTHLFLMFYADSHEGKLSLLFRALKRSDQPQKADACMTGTMSHVGIGCNGCGVKPIVGPRHKCIYCENYELCLRCATARIHGTHDIFLVTLHPQLGETLSASFNKIRGLNLTIY